MAAKIGLSWGNGSHRSWLRLLCWLQEKAVGKRSMKILNPDKDPSRFFVSLGESRSCALLLDYDGTLAPFVVERDEAVPYAGVSDVLEGLIENQVTRLVIITGRGLHDIIPLLGLEPPPEIWGSHGGERLFPDGTHQRATLPSKTSHALASAVGWMEKMGWGAHVERKPLGVAVHWRGVEPTRLHEMQNGLLEVLPRIIAGTGLSVHAFDGGLELRPPEISKGAAVEAILAEMEDKVVAAYLGDDLTDEDGFAAVKKCTSLGLGVLVREELRETEADLWLRPPEELLDFLRNWQKTATDHVR